MCPGLSTATFPEQNGVKPDAGVGENYSDVSDSKMGNMSSVKWFDGIGE
jgi:outer membrane protein W